MFPVLLLNKQTNIINFSLRYLRRLPKTFHKNSNASQYIRRGKVELCGGLRMPTRAIPIICPTRQNSMELSTSSKIIWIHFLTVYPKLPMRIQILLSTKKGRQWTLWWSEDAYEGFSNNVNNTTKHLLSEIGPWFPAEILTMSQAISKTSYENSNPSQN